MTSRPQPPLRRGHILTTYNRPRFAIADERKAST